MSQVRKFFAGGNTPLGFHSFYHEIIDEQANRLFILKGGPGTGKSTLMRKIGTEMLAQGYDVEEFNCSSDIGSIDAIAVPALKVAIVDGTAPHMIDPKYPGCVDEIINLGNFWDEDQIARRKETIISLTKAKNYCYTRVYRYLRAARELYDDMQDINHRYLDLHQVNQVARNLLAEIFHAAPTKEYVGKMRHLFASAITPQGPVNELHSIMDRYHKQYILKGEPGTNKLAVVERIANHAVESGYYVEAFHCVMDPNRIEHIAIPELDVGIIASYPPHIYESSGAEVINLNEYLDQYQRLTNQHILHKDFVYYDELMNLVFKQLRHAKAIHDDLELNYIRYMDFSKYEQIKRDIITKMLSYSSSN